jgi:hypothetical protein
MTFITSERLASQFTHLHAVVFTVRGAVRAVVMDGGLALYTSLANIGASQAVEAGRTARG